MDANSRVGPSVRASLWTISDSLGYLHFTIWAGKKTMKTMTKDEQLVMSQGVVSKWNQKIKALLVVKKKDGC